MELTPDLVPLTVMPIESFELHDATLSLEVEGIEFVVWPPDGTVHRSLYGGTAGRQYPSHSIYVRPEDLGRARAAVQGKIPGYLLEG